MHSSFWFDSVFPNLIFKGYTISSVGGFVATCLGLASLAIILEIIKVYRASMYLKKSAFHESRSAHSPQSHQESSVQSQMQGRKDMIKLLALQTSWYTVQDVIGYIVMLAVMSYNGYFLLAVLLGGAVGYFIFGPWLMDIKLTLGSVCSQKQRCAVCIAKMEQSHLLSSNSQISDAGSQNETSSSLAEVAEGLAGVMQSSSEERVAVEVHAPHEHCA